MLSAKRPGKTGAPKRGEWGRRVADWLHATYQPPKVAAQVAADWRVSISVAGEWLAGKCPPSWFLEAMTERWGGRFFAAVFAGALEADAALLEQLNRTLEALQALERKRDHYAGDAVAAGDAGRGPVHGLCRVADLPASPAWRLAVRRLVQSDADAHRPGADALVAEGAAPGGAWGGLIGLLVAAAIALAGPMGPVKGRVSVRPPARSSVVRVLKGAGPLGLRAVP